MIQKYKELLLKELCARLPYGVKGIRTYRPKEPVTLGEIIPRCKMNPNVGNGSFCELGFDETLDCCVITEFKPYLFPLSSMTEEERFAYEQTQWEYQTDYCAIEYFDGLESYDWLNIHHFDYRGLIDKGLAIDATGLNIY